MSELAALSMGARRVAGTPQASFIIKIAGQRVRATKEDLFYLKQRFMFNQRRTAKGELLHIEKSKYRINTPGELSGITFKGLDMLSTKRKGLMGGKRGRFL